MSVKFWLDPDIALATNLGYGRKELRKIERMSRENVEDLRNAWAAFAAKRIEVQRIIGVAVTEDTLTVDLEDGRTLSVPIGWYPRLAYGTPEERNRFEIGGGGYGIHWPDLDEDIGVEGLLLGKQSMESPASLEAWLRSRKQAS